MRVFHCKEQRVFGETVGFRVEPKTLPNEHTKSCIARRRAPSMEEMSRGPKNRFEGTALVSSRMSEASKYRMSVIMCNLLNKNEDS